MLLLSTAFDVVYNTSFCNACAFSSQLAQSDMYWYIDMSLAQCYSTCELYFNIYHYLWQSGRSSHDINIDDSSSLIQHLGQHRDDTLRPIFAAVWHKHCTYLGLNACSF